MFNRDLTRRRTLGIRKLSRELDSAMKRLESLEGLTCGSPGYTELVPYLRIAIASLRTAMARTVGPQGPRQDS